MKKGNKAGLVLRKPSINMELGTSSLIESQNRGILPPLATSLFQYRCHYKCSHTTKTISAQTPMVSSQFNQNEQIPKTSLPRAAAVRLQSLLVQALALLVSQAVHQHKIRRKLYHRKGVAPWVASSSLRSSTTFRSQKVATKAQVWLPQAKTTHTLKTRLSSSQDLSNHSTWLQSSPPLKKTKKISSLYSSLT